MFVFFFRNRLVTTTNDNDDIIMMIKVCDDQSVHQIDCFLFFFFDFILMDNCSFWKWPLLNSQLSFLTRNTHTHTHTFITLATIIIIIIIIIIQIRYEDLFRYLSNWQLLFLDFFLVPFEAIFFIYSVIWSSSFSWFIFIGIHKQQQQQQQQKTI